MSLGWWLIPVLYALGSVAAVRPFAKAEARDRSYYCYDGRRAVSEPCPDRGWHDSRCGPRDAKSIGASAVGHALLWLPIVAIWIAFQTWDGVTGFIGCSVTRLSAGTVDPRRLAELERELGIGDE